MKSFEKLEFPEIKARTGIVVTDVEDARAALKASGVPFASNGLNDGDEVSFPKTFETLRTKTVTVDPLRPVDGPKSVLVGVVKNGNPAWLSAGTLRRRGATADAYACDFSRNLANNYIDDAQRIESLLGKTIVVNGTMKVATTVFDENRQPTAKTIDRDFAIIEFGTPSKNAEYFA